MILTKCGLKLTDKYEPADQVPKEWSLLSANHQDMSFEIRSLLTYLLDEAPGLYRSESISDPDAHGLADTGVFSSTGQTRAGLYLAY